MLLAYCIDFGFRSRSPDFSSNWHCRSSLRVDASLTRLGALRAGREFNAADIAQGVNAAIESRDGKDVLVENAAIGAGDQACRCGLAGS